MNPDKAVNVLDKMNIHDYHVNQNKIEIEGHISETSTINAVLVNENISVDEIYVQSEALEDHYLKLTGGNES